VIIKRDIRSLSQRPGVRYALSLPERVLRSASAVSAGLVREVADVALPIGIRRGRLYRNLVDATLRFMIEDVGEVEGVYPSDEKLAQDFLLRRTVGNGIDVMGVLAFRASPMWTLAALADICGAGRQLIPEIAEALKQEGMLDSAASFTSMEQLLEGLEGTAAQLAETVNTPPLNVAGLRAEWAKFAAEARGLPTPKLPSATDLTRLWSDLRATAVTQDRSVFEVSALLAVSAIGSLPERARVLSRSAAIVVGTGGGVLSQGLLDHYRTTLGELRGVGFLAYGSRQLSPYLGAARKLFSPQHGTLTEKYVEKI
jgi:hypothetical protein